MHARAEFGRFCFKNTSDSDLLSLVTQMFVLALWGLCRTLSAHAQYHIDVGNKPFEVTRMC